MSCGPLQGNREALQKKEVERQADLRAKQQELAIALQVSLLPGQAYDPGSLLRGQCVCGLVA